jgi:hypothetical protein
MGETDLDAVILEMDKVQAVDKEVSQDPLASAIGVMPNIVVAIGDFEQQFFLLRGNCYGNSGAGFGKRLGFDRRFGVRAALMLNAFRGFHCQSPRVQALNGAAASQPGASWKPPNYNH